MYFQERFDIQSKRATQVGEEINVRWQCSSLYLDEQSNLTLGSHRGWMTLGLLHCKNDSEIFRLLEIFRDFYTPVVLVYNVSAKEQVYIDPQKPEGCLEMNVFQLLTCISLKNLEGQKLTVVQFFRGFRGVKLRGALHCNGCCSSLGLCCCVPGCPQGCSS